MDVTQLFLMPRQQKCWQSEAYELIKQIDAIALQEKSSWQRHTKPLQDALRAGSLR